MKRVLTAVVLIPVVLLAVLTFPGWAVAALAGMVGILATREFLQMVTTHAIEPFRIPVYVALVLYFASLCRVLGAGGNLLRGMFLNNELFVAALVLCLFLCALSALRRRELATSLPAMAASLSALIYIALPLSWAASLCGAATGKHLLVYLMLVVWAGDISAYYVGRTMGKHRLAPRISPNKTWEGAGGSLVASLVVGSAFLHWYPSASDYLVRAHLFSLEGYWWVEGINLPQTAGVALLLSAGVNIAAQLGDLFESMLKRGAGMKDSGALVPGHGGVLDRIDALLFALPVVWYYAAFHTYIT